MAERSSEPLEGLGRSVLIGGAAAGVLSVFPGLNLLNLFFMTWIVLGAGLTIHLLYRRPWEANRTPTRRISLSLAEFPQPQPSRAPASRSRAAR